MEEVERGERMPLPQSVVLGAKHLPRTILKQVVWKTEAGETRARRFYGKTYDEFPGAEALVVRVVSFVDKKLEVKQQFLEIFQEENYPVEFGYKSKKIEGVEVCLFGMYVLEFGEECPQPNHQRVYLSIWIQSTTFTQGHFGLFLISFVCLFQQASTTKSFVCLFQQAR
uniref:histone acetyltransferase n=1 Tax=Lactuca sativa TaxID=4236 RepID=A0A9R1VDY6_LACSA|nr:hypothetical protein LSAT_V11C500233220 [Lactuca sativa]